MAFRARNNSHISVDTESTYSQSTQNERDDDDNSTIEDTQDPHVATPDENTEAPGVPSKKAQSSPESQVDTQNSISARLAEIRTKVTDWFDEAAKALSEVSLPDECLKSLDDVERIEKDRVRLHYRKEYYKEQVSDLMEKNDELKEELNASRKETAQEKSEKDELRESARKLFA